MTPFCPLWQWKTVHYTLFHTLEEFGTFLNCTVDLCRFMFDESWCRLLWSGGYTGVRTAYFERLCFGNVQSIRFHLIVMLVFEYYAELLPNIKSISLLVFLSTPATVHTWTTIDPGSSFATLHHNGESAGLILPADVNPGLHQLVIRPRHGVRTLSSRLPLAVPLPIALTSDRNNAPWSASDLSSMASVSFCCRSCGAVLIPADQITHWKDLPSRNWADMMDFWHCHKPSHNVKVKPGESHKYSTFGKGFVLDQGTGLVDRSFFLFLNQDCEAAKVCSRYFYTLLPLLWSTWVALSTTVNLQKSSLGNKKVPNCYPWHRYRWLRHRYNYPRSNPVNNPQTKVMNISSCCGIGGFAFKSDGSGC